MVSNDNNPPVVDTAADMLLPFLIDKTHLHGRFVRLSDAVDAILSRHDYPLPVSYLLAELLVMTALLSRSLKHDGIVTIQVQSDGPVRLMVSDVNAEGQLRGYAALDDEAQEYFRTHASMRRTIEDICGKGYLAITLDHQQGKQPYQGIVELSGTNLTECCLRYMQQSDQFSVHLKTVVALSSRYDERPKWRAAGMMVQRFPDEVQNQPVILPDPVDDSNPEDHHSSEDDWNRTIMFVDSLTEKEMLDTDLHPKDVLFRLFHEDGVWVYDASAFDTSCRCNRERLIGILKAMPAKDLDHLLKKDEQVVIQCQFCNTKHELEAAELRGDSA